MSERLFRVADADALVPRLAEIFTLIRAEIERAQELARELGESGYRVRADGGANLDLTAPVEIQRKQRHLLEISEKIAERLNDGFQLLTGGSRTALPRHQTLQALIDWSYFLLTPPEQTLLRRLSVFAGGWQKGRAIWRFDADSSLDYDFSKMKRWE